MSFDTSHTSWANILISLVHHKVMGLFKNENE